MRAVLNILNVILGESLTAAGWWLYLAPIVADIIQWLAVIGISHLKIAAIAL
ncbi:hypothetical protein ACGVWS_12970 [Enterobacteriaceae bacterium LUAb1]